jgi:hypothetical protein
MHEICDRWSILLLLNSADVKLNGYISHQPRSEKLDNHDDTQDHGRFMKRHMGKGHRK